MATETDQQWWERIIQEIRRCDAEQILASDEAFTNAVRAVLPSQAVPMTVEEADRLVDQVISRTQEVGRTRPSVAHGLAASGERQPRPVEQEALEDLCILASESDASHLTADSTGRLSIMPAPLQQFTHLRIGNLKFPLRHGASVIYVDGAGRADVEDYLCACKEMGVEPKIELFSDATE